MLRFQAKRVQASTPNRQQKTTAICDRRAYQSARRETDLPEPNDSAAGKEESHHRRTSMYLSVRKILSVGVCRAPAIPVRRQRLKTPSRSGQTISRWRLRGVMHAGRSLEEEDAEFTLLVENKQTAKSKAPRIIKMPFHFADWLLTLLK